MSQKKLPYIPLYVGDWLKDPALRTCSLEEKGAWVEMMLAMHESEERGYLVVNGKSLNARDISKVLGVSFRQTKRIVQTLLDKNIASRRESDGAIFSRRIVKDEKTRKKRADGGKLGGSPKKS